MSSKYEDWSLEQIKKELRLRGAKTSGRKVDCVERLEAYDRNQNFGKDPENVETVYKIDLPPLDSYKDLNTTAKIPVLSEASVNMYLIPFGKTLGEENKLWKSRFLRYVRWCSIVDQTFIRGNCRAEMRKSVAYDVDLLIDKHGNLRQTQCECAAGMGPNAHCKHVLCLIFCVIQFFSSGNLNTELTCTEKLQSFHKAKLYLGSPKKMGNTNFGKQKVDNVRFDPRKANCVKKNDCKINYNAFVYNQAVNFSSETSATNMPIMQMIPPANPYALCHDHDYCSLTQEDHLLKHLNITSATDADCQQLEADTRGQASSQRWREERLHRLHSSQFGRLCKSTSRTDMEALAKSYTMETRLNSAPIRHGKTFESIAIREYERSTGNVVNACGIFVNPDCPFIASSPDGVVDSDLLIEVKCPYVAKDKPITAVSIPYLSEDSGNLTLSSKHDYYYQVQGQLYCSGRNICDFIVYTKVDMIIIRITRDTGFIDNTLLKLRHFFDAHFKLAVLNKYLYRDYYNFKFHGK